MPPRRLRICSRAVVSLRRQGRFRRELVDPDALVEQRRIVVVQRSDNVPYGMVGDQLVIDDLLGVYLDQYRP